MRKFMFLLILLINITVFAEKITTDGKNNLDKLNGNWGNSPDDIVIIKKNNNKWIIGFYAGDCEGIPRCSNGISWHDIQLYKNNVFILKDFYKIPSKKDKNLYFGYDTKYKKLVFLDHQLNILGIINRK